MQPMAWPRSGHRISSSFSQMIWASWMWDAYATHLSDTRLEDRFYETPHIDALTGKGIAFSQAYANQLCSPTRAAILTGQYASRNWG